MSDRIRSKLKIPTARVFEPLLAPKTYKGAYGGRGSGKSHFFAEGVIEKLLMKPGSRAVCIREIQVSLEQSSKRLVEDKLKQHQVGHLFGVYKDRIVGPRDGLIIFRGMQGVTDEAMKSLEGYDLAWVDEAQSLSMASLNKLYPTIRKEGAEIWFSWNPKSPEDPVETFLRGKNPHPDSIAVMANWQDNPWFTDKLRADMEFDKKRDYEMYRHIWEGAYQMMSEARVFRNFVVAEFETPKTQDTFYLGADWGFSTDPTVLVRCWIDGRKLYIDHEVWEVGCEIDKTPELFDKLIPGRPGWAKNWHIRADNARPETISYMRKHGYPRMTGALKGKDSVEEGVTFIQSFDVIIHPRCTHVAREFATYSWKVDKKTERVIPVLADANNHTIDSVRYAVEEVRRKPVKPTFGSY